MLKIKRTATIATASHTPQQETTEETNKHKWQYKQLEKR